MSSLAARFRQTLAQQLDVDAADGRGAWLLRLAFRPPRPGQRDWPAHWARRLGSYLRFELALGPDEGAGTWLKRLFFRPYRRRVRLAMDLRSARHHRGCDRVRAAAHSWGSRAPRRSRAHWCERRPA